MSFSYLNLVRTQISSFSRHFLNKNMGLDLLLYFFLISNKILFIEKTLIHKEYTR